MTPIGMFVSLGLPPFYPGRHGMFFDLWWGCLGPPFGDGQTYAGAAAQAFVQLGPVIFPWDGSATMNKT
jgi:hypothetical protein